MKLMMTPLVWFRIDLMSHIVMGILILSLSPCLSACVCLWFWQHTKIETILLYIYASRCSMTMQCKAIRLWYLCVNLRHSIGQYCLIWNAKCWCISITPSMRRKVKWTCIQSDHTNTHTHYPFALVKYLSCWKF